MNRSWGTPPWQADTFIVTQPEPIERRSHDVVIVGGGFTGLSAAYHLARRGVDVALVEASTFGAGASGRTGGLVLEGTAAGVRPGANDCVPFLERLVADEHIDCGLELPGCWLIAHSEGGATTLPWRDDKQAIHVTETIAGGVVNPLALVRGLARIAAKAGAVLYANTPVVKMTAKPLTIELEHTTLTPRTLIVATNAWLSDLLPNLRVEIRSCLTFALATEPLDDSTRSALGLGGGLPFFTIDQPYLWGRTLYDGALLIGGGLLYGPPAGLEQIGTDNDDVRAVFERVERRIHGLNPALANVRIAARWGGPIAITRDYLPLIGPLPENPQVLVAGGYTGHGVALGVKVGALLADAITDGKPLPDWASPSR
jgi:gamma-glutamylputrescine oxidase